ncbi:MAG: glucosaminidase domain-containing protein [Desulfobulbaceae bacterium]|nr:glucosaminidase domain-containing protein [Desulfobulbaceae bacterium]
MNHDSPQRSVDFRNLLFTMGGLAIVLLLIVFVRERTVLQEPPVVAEKQVKVEKKKLTQKTTLDIQPLVTRFGPLPDFNSYRQVEKRKAAFIDYLSPIIEYQNNKILHDRARLEKVARRILNGEALPGEEKRWLKQLADKYEVQWNSDDPAAAVFRLARRVDVIPLSLALVQAAKESSWGRSRYAVEVNNLFGQWCYDQGCGVIPGERPADAIHEVKRFNTVSDATRSYIHNLNTHPQYARLRRIRQNLRMRHEPLSGRVLAEGLLYYSERRQAYVREVKEMIHQFHLFQQQRTG